MAFTGKLGTSRSELAKIELGHKPVSVFTDSFSDTLTFNDRIGVGWLLVDTLTFVDVMIPTWFMHDTVTFTDAMTDYKIAVGSISDTLTLADYFLFPLHDIMTLSDTFTEIQHFNRAISDTLTLSETLTYNLIAVRTTFETLTLTELLTRHLVRLRDMTETITFSDTFAGYVSHPLTDTLTFSDTATEFISKKFIDVIDFDSLFSYDAVYHRNIADQVVLFDNLSYTATLHKALSDTVTLADTFSGAVVHPLTPDTISFSDTITETNSKPMYETVTFSDSFAVNKVLNRSFEDVVTFLETITEKKISHLSFADLVVLVDEELGIRVKHGIMTDSVTFTDKFFRTLVEVLATDTVNFSDTETVHTVFKRALLDALSLVGTLDEDAVLHRSMNDSVTLSDGFMVKLVGNGGPPDFVRELPGGAFEGIITVKPQVVIVGFARSIILPAPEFNDYEANQGKIAVQRSMLGRFRVYSKRTNREKVNWHFILPKPKADEFEAFILAEINNDLDITDFKGHKWHAKILSDSVDFTETGRWEPCGNKVEVTLEFEGVKYA